MNKKQKNLQDSKGDSNGAQSLKEGKIFQIHILTFQALSITLFVIDERYQLVTGKSQ